MKKGEEQKKPTKPVAPELPPTTDDDASPPAKPRKKKGAAALPKQVDVPEQEQPAMQVDDASTALHNNRQQRSARRLLAFQELKRAALARCSNSSKLAAQRWAWRKSCSSTRRGGSGSRRRARGCVMSSGVPGTPSTDRSGVV
jgi:type IV secretory pathway VirB10-like protein